MIAHLEGTVFDIAADAFILKVSGTGYEVLATTQTLVDVQLMMGQNIGVWIYHQVREDAEQLFGFLTKTEKEFFTQLLRVNGVGPKMALSIMSGARSVQIQDWIEAGDAKALSSLPKVGKKTAEQIILTLQGKLVRVNSLTDKSKNIKPQVENHRLISSALINLGFKNQSVEQFISSLAHTVTVEDGVRQGLLKLSGQG